MLEAEVVTSSQTMKNIEDVFFTERRWEKFSYSYNIGLSVVFHDNPVLRWAVNLRESLMQANIHFCLYKAMIIKFYYA